MLQRQAAARATLRVASARQIETRVNPAEAVSRERHQRPIERPSSLPRPQGHKFQAQQTAAEPPQVEPKGVWISYAPDRSIGSFEIACAIAGIDHLLHMHSQRRRIKFNHRPHGIEVHVEIRA